MGIRWEMEGQKSRVTEEGVKDVDTMGVGRAKVEGNRGRGKRWGYNVRWKGKGRGLRRKGFKEK